MDFAPDSSAPQRAGDIAALIEQMRVSVSQTGLLNARVQLALARGYLDMLRTSATRATCLRLYQRAVQLHESAQRGRDKLALSALPAVDPQGFHSLDHGIIELSARLADVLQYISAVLRARCLAGSTPRLQPFHP